MVRIVLVAFLTVLVCSFSANGWTAVGVEQDSQRPGGDYTSFPTATVQQCVESCEKSLKCQAFDFYKSDHSCWLKSIAYPSRYYAGVTSGAKGQKDRQSVGQQITRSTREFEISQDTQRPGGDYTRFQAKNAAECSRVCSQDRRCVAFDYTATDHYCYLKSWTPRARYYRGITSGVKTYADSRVKSVQELLIQQHYDVGVADGLMGRKTALALESYQRDYSLPVTGSIDDTTLTTMGVMLPAPEKKEAQETVKERWPTRTEEKKQETAGVKSPDKLPPPPVPEVTHETLLLQVKTVGVTYMQMDSNIYADVLGTIPAGTVLQVISETGKWYRISYQNQVGYILAESVERL